MIEPRGVEGTGNGEEILRTVAVAARRFARGESWEDVIREVLHLIGAAAGVSRAYVFENSKSDDGRLLMTERYEWCRPGVIPTIQDPENHEYPYRPEYARWERTLGAGSSIFGPAREFPDIERPDMEKEGIRSAALVPIFAGKDWWGFMGLDDCENERKWTSIELDSLEAAAETLGSAILRSQSESRLNEAEQKFREMVEHLPAIIYLSEAGSDGDWLYLSPQIKTVLGYTPEEWMNHPAPFSTHVHPDDLEDALETEGAMGPGDVFKREYRMFTRDGREIWIYDECRLRTDASGREPFLQGVMMDVTDRRTAEDRLRDVETKYNRLLERRPDLLILED